MRAPERQGFGSRLIQGTLPKVELTYAPEGLRCAIKLKLNLRGQGRKPDGPAADRAGGVASTASGPCAAGVSC